MTESKVYFGVTAYNLLIFLAIFGSSGCGTPVVKSVLDAIREPAIEVLTNVINDRMDSMVDKDTAVCWELPEGFQSGQEELDDDERGVFAVCWARAAE
ncbi:MAG: hypothetical protein O7G84_13655 [Gammaproteobacteria bacterium]|nr:hypothetical protein [Gammaproteobacteria bacterium]